MKVLSVKQACTILKVSDFGPSTVPLVEQARSYLMNTPFVVLDVDGVHFSSMLLGEVVNLYVEFSNHWKDQRHGMAMAHVPEVSKKVFQVSKLTDRIPIHDSLDDAMRSFSLPALKADSVA